jgi:hypothetical protein
MNAKFKYEKPLFVDLSIESAMGRCAVDMETTQPITSARREAALPVPNVRPDGAPRLVMLPGTMRAIQVTRLARAAVRPYPKFGRRVMRAPATRAWVHNGPVEVMAAMRLRTALPVEIGDTVIAYEV